MCQFFLECFILFHFLFIVNCEKSSYFGCYHKENAGRIGKTTYNVAECVEACENLYYRYAALFDADCSCLNTIQSQILLDNDCDTKCRSNQEEFCGGLAKNTQSIYETGIEVAGPVTSLRIIGNAKDTSIQIAWNPPPAAGIPVTQYEISANVLRTFANHRILSPTWKLQNNTDQFELSNLHPGTSYNITITSISAKGEGGMSSQIAETEIGIPDPQPETPVILERFDTSILIEIKKGVNNNGPINWYRVIVHYVGDDILQDYDEKLLQSFQKSKDDGLPYYIAAELEIKNESRKFTVGDGRTYQHYFNPPIPVGMHVHISIGHVSVYNNVIRVRYAQTSHEQDGDDLEHVNLITYEPEDNQIMITVLSAACVIFGVILAVSIGVYLYLRFKSPIRPRPLSDHHELQLQGPILEVENNGYVPDAYEQRNFNEELSNIIHSISVDKKLSRKLLSLDIDNIIGTGNYGDVLKGNLRRQETDLSCQVHVVSDDMEKLHQITFLNEFNQIIRLQRHPKIIEFYGVCVTPDWCYVICEDMQVTLKQVLLNARIPNNVSCPKFSSISEDVIISILFNVCDAMQFLVENNIVNKKLCARSIYINTKYEIKLSAFGPMLNGENNQPVDAIRWVSPEAMKFQSYTTKGDVWSFGILVWECCCLGATPYGNITTDNLFSQIKNGNRPEKPSFMFDDLYQMCLNCWDIEASERPEFEDLGRHLRQMSSMLRYVLSFERNSNIQLPPYLSHIEAKYF